MLYNGVTRATRIAKLAPGTLIRVEVVDTLRHPVGNRPTIGDLLPCGRCRPGTSAGWPGQFKLETFARWFGWGLCRSSGSSIFRAWPTARPAAESGEPRGLGA
jgi:hypothetical protein